MLKEKTKGKIFRTSLLVLVMIAVIGLAVYITRTEPVDSSVNIFCYDDAEIFSESQEDYINEICKTVQTKNGINIYVSTCDKNSELGIQTGETFLRVVGLTQTDNLVVIIINTQGNSNYHFDFYTFGLSAKKITDDEIEKILYSDGADLILTSNSENAILGVGECVEKLGFAYEWTYNLITWILTILIAILIGAFIASFTIKFIKKNYSKKRNVENYSFESNVILELNEKEDKFIRKTVTSTVISSSNSSGGGGHSSGGGGGGGHRGGR